MRICLEGTGLAEPCEWMGFEKRKEKSKPKKLMIKLKQKKKWNEKRDGG